MEENNKTEQVLNGKEIYPYMDGKIIHISIMYDLREHYKRILKLNAVIDLLKEKGYEVKTFLKFKDLLIEDIDFLDTVVRNYFAGLERVLISDRDTEKIYGVTLKDKKEPKYTLRLVERFCDLNREHFFEDYIDVFGNKIEFK